MSTIEFPGLLDLKFTISRVAFSIFGIPIYWYGIIIAVGFMTAVLWAMKDSPKFGIDSENIIDLVLFAAPISVVTARLYYVIFNWSLYKDNLLDVFNTRKGGLAIYGAVIGGLITAYVFARVKKINFFALFDFGTPYLVLAQAIGRWGNFVNQEAFGTNTTLPWGMTGDAIRENLKAMNIPGVNPDLPVHPTFLYESLWDLGVFLLLMWFRKRRKLDGEVFCLYMIGYGVGRALIEGLRTDSLMLGSLRISQVLAVVFAVVFTGLFIYRRRKFATAPAVYKIEMNDRLKIIKTPGPEESDNDAGDIAKDRNAEDEKAKGGSAQNDSAKSDNTEGGSAEGDNDAGR